MEKKRTGPSPLSSLGLGLAILVLIACGGSPSPTEPAGQPTAATTPAEAQLPSPEPTAGATPTLRPACNFLFQPSFYAALPAGRSAIFQDKTHQIQNKDFWTSSTPEEQGMDAEILKAGLPELGRSSTTLSLLIIRNDVIVFERYPNGGSVEQSTNIHSVSKSIISTLVGIAIEEGYIESINQRVSDFFPEYFPADDPRKDKMTLRHLLTMTSGFEWQDSVSTVGGDDWIKAILKLPLDRAPGTIFNYSTAASHLTSAILERATGMSTCEFAYRYLFEPLDISVEHWGRDPQGYYMGGNNVFLTPREMAKFGLLYLHEGQWQGEQVVSREWVEQATSAQATPEYGYYWWRTPREGYTIHSALGYGGQRVHVIPELNTVVVSTADSRYELDPIDSLDFIADYVIPAVEDAR
jgi:CubicO group peptidase (beta-lactamase class C family)